MKVAEYTLTGSKGTRIVSDAVFAVPMNETLLAQAIHMYASNMHQATSGSQTRSDVTRTKRKWFKQKGTGNARHGARSAPIFVGGGVAHGPKSLKAANIALNTKQKQRALAVALSARSSAITVIPGLEVMDHKTAPVARLLAELQLDSVKSILVVTSSSDLLVAKAIRNIKNVSFVPADQVHALDIAAVSHIVLSPEAVTSLEARLGSSVSQKKTPSQTAKPVAKKSADTKTASTASTSKTKAAKTKAPAAKKTKATKKVTSSRSTSTTKTKKVTK